VSSDDVGGPPSAAALLAGASKLNKRVHSSQDAVDPSHADATVERSVQILKPSAPPLHKDPTYEKYYRMLKMGLPHGAVQNAMIRDDIDPTILDLDPERSLASQRPPADEVQPKSIDPKYLKMIEVGLPLGAVKNSMKRDGLDLSSFGDIDTLLLNGNPMQNTQPDDSTISGTSIQGLIDEKYFRMLKMGLSLGAVKNSMQREGLDLSQFGDLDTMLLSRDFDESLAEEKKVDSVDERSHRSVDLPPPAPAPIGIGALAAAAALKKQSARSDEPATSPGPMGIGALAAAAALKNQSKNGGIQKDSPIDGAVQEPAIRDDPRFSKYFRMLKMGLPMGAVKNAMQRDEQDDTIMDLDPDKSLESQRPPQIKGGGDDGPPLNKDPVYEKYFRMLKMGLPMGAVKNAMQRDGQNPQIMDLDPNKPVASQLKSDDDDALPLKEDPTFAKYFKMLKMGLPMGAVKNAMQRDGQNPDIMDLDPEKSVASQMKKDDEDEEADTGPPLKDDPAYSKYFKMLKMGLPSGAVKNAMQRDGLNPDIMDLDPEKSVASQLNKNDEEEDDGPPLKDDPAYSKYFKMLKMGLPIGAVKNAMQRDGLDASIMDLDHDKSIASQLNKGDDEPVDKGPPLKDDPTYAKYFKMLKMGLPAGAVQNAMQRDGVDPSILDFDHDKSVEYQKAMASHRGKKKKVAKKKEAKKKPKVRRKKIFWTPVEESTIEDNSLWSMIKGSYDFDSLKVDQDEFESLFTDTMNPAEKKKKVAKENDGASKQKKSVQVIDAKRGMNGGIILARIKLEFSEIADMVNEMDCGKLDDTQLKALREFLPTKEERFAIQGYVKGASASKKTKEAAINDFCACEKYMYAMTEVEMADEKFECMLFKYQFDNKLKELTEGVTTLISACEDVQKSVRLRKLMAMILMLGNQINTGGSGRVAHGFTLDALLKLDEAKAFDKKTSVLQYLVKIVKANEPDLLKVHEEMPSIVPAENVVVESLVSELKELNDQLDSVKATAEAEGRRIRDGKEPDLNISAIDKLKQQKTEIKDVDGVSMYNEAFPTALTPMEQFVQYAEKKTKEALDRTDEVQENFKGVLSYFGEDPAMTSTAFFGTLNKFVAAFDSALEVVKRIEKAEIQEEKKRQAALAKEKAKKAAKAVTVAKKISGRATEGLQRQQPKGKLDLTGQRKQFADPFAGPDDVRDDQADDKQAGAVPLKSGIAALAAAAAAKKTSNRVNAESLADIEPSSCTDLEEKSPKTDNPQKPAGHASLGIGALAAAAALKKNSHEDESSDPETKPMPPLSRAPPMGIAAMAAAAAQAKNSLSQEDCVPSPGTNGFFPATKPRSPIKELSSPKSNEHVNAREERYRKKTSSDARTEEAVLHVKSDDFAFPPSSPMAKGIRREVVEAGRASLRHIEVPMLEPDSVPPPPPFGSPDPKTEAKVMLVGAMAAAAARNRTPKTIANKCVQSPEAEKENITGDSAKVLVRQPPMSIGALAAQAARAKKQGDDVKESSNLSSQTTKQVAETSESRTRSGRTEGIEAIGGSTMEVETIISDKTSETASIRASPSLKNAEKLQNESSPDIPGSNETDRVKDEILTQTEKERDDIEKQDIQQGKTIEELEAELNNPELNAEERKRLKKKLKKKRQKMKKST